MCLGDASANHPLQIRFVTDPKFSSSDSAALAPIISLLLPAKKQGSTEQAKRFNNLTKGYSTRRTEGLGIHSRPRLLAHHPPRLACSTVTIRGCSQRPRRADIFGF